jgi:hypothetical protein
MPKTPTIRLSPAQRAGNLRTGTIQAWGGSTADGLWRWRRIETPSTPWELTHLPTGLTLEFGREDLAISAAADPGTLALFRKNAEDTIAQGGRRADTMVMALVNGRLARVDEPAARRAVRVGEAQRVLAVLDGRISVGIPDGVCGCGGLLAGQIHADACRECHTTPLADRRRCDLLAQHVACADPEPVQCDHPQCRADGAICGDILCRTGRDWCCGCCIV